MGFWVAAGLARRRPVDGFLAAPLLAAEVGMSALGVLVGGSTKAAVSCADGQRKLAGRGCREARASRLCGQGGCGSGIEPKGAALAGSGDARMGIVNGATWRGISGAWS